MTRRGILGALLAPLGSGCSRWFNQGRSELQKLRSYWEARMGRGEGRLQPGDPAPDFDLKRQHSEERVRLADFRGKKPVALVFGSYT